MTWDKTKVFLNRITGGCIVSTHGDPKRAEWVVHPPTREKAEAAERALRDSGLTPLAP